MNYLNTRGVSVQSFDAAVLSRSSITYLQVIKVHNYKMPGIPIPRKALLAVTSAAPPFYPGGKRTGVDYTEALNSFQGLTKAGFEIDIASETGTSGFDERSLEQPGVAPLLKHPNNKFNEKFVKSIFKASELAAHDYGVFFAVGGHGAAYDFPHGKHLQAIASDIYKRGGIVAAVCHGPAIFENMRDDDGELIARGRIITGFTTEGELEMHTIDQLRADNVHPVEETARRIGATFKGPEFAFRQFVKVDERIVTGSNPASVEETVRDTIKIYENAAGNI